MAENSEIAELQRTVRRLETELDQVLAGKLPRQNPWQRGLLSFAIFWALFAGVSHFIGAFGYSYWTGYFYTVRASSLRLEEDWDGTNCRADLVLYRDHPTLRMDGGHGNTVDIDSREIRLKGADGSASMDPEKITLQGKRGTLILELGDEGEPVLRSIPAKK